jgi:hypothetical protein
MSIINKITNHKYFHIKAEKTGNIKFSFEGLRREDDIPSYMLKIAEDERFLLENYTKEVFFKEIEGYFRALEFIDEQVYNSLRSVIDEFRAYAGLSFITVTHSFIREFGAYTLYKKSEMNDNVYHDAFFSYLSRNWKITDQKPVYPRGKNTGAPIVISGSNRFLNDIIMLINAAISEFFWRTLIKRNYAKFMNDIDIAKDMITQLFAEPRYIVFSRYQHISPGKDIPKFVKGIGWLKTNGIEARRRIINSTVKLFAMINKHFITHLTHCDLETPEFCVDDKIIRERVRNCFEKGGIVLAMDHSRFDLRHGGDKMTAGLKGMSKYIALKLLGDINATDAVFKALSTESYLDTYLTDMGNVYVADGRLAIKSGDSKTSRLDSYLVLCEDMYVTKESLGLSYEETVNYYKKYQPSSILGDDLIKFFPSKDDAEKYMRYLPEFNQKHGVMIEEEKPTMFLGKLIVRKAPYTINRIENLLIRYCFPERKKKPIAIPFQIMARYQLAKDSGYSEHIALKLAKFFCDFNKYIIVNNERKRNDIITGYEFWKNKHNIDITNINDVRKAYDKLIKDPISMGLDNSFELIDEVLHTFGRGLEHYVDLSLIGVPDAITKLQHIAFPDFESLFNVINSAAPTNAILGEKKRKYSDEFVGKVNRYTLERLKEKVMHFVKNDDINNLANIYKFMIEEKYNLGLVHRGHNDFLSEKTNRKLKQNMQERIIKKNII